MPGVAYGHDNRETKDLNSGMRTVPKVLIAAAGVTGFVAYGLPQPWSLLAAVADLLLVALAGGLRLRVGRSREVFLRHRIESSEFQGYPQQGHPGEHEETPRSRRRTRWSSSAVGEVASPTSRVRRQPRAQPTAFLTSAPDPAELHQGLANLENLVRTTNRRGQRAQWWFFLAGVAVSIPAGVVVNLLTD